MHRFGIERLKRKELQRLAVWLDVPVRNKVVETLKAECKAAWDEDKIFLTDRIKVPPPPPGGKRAGSYKSSEDYKSRTVQSGST